MPIPLGEWHLWREKSRINTLRMGVSGDGSFVTVVLNLEARGPRILPLSVISFGCNFLR